MILETYLKTFVKWIAPEPETEDAIREQAESIRSRISAKAADDNLTIRSTPNSGSFAKRTGLRRHMRGNNEIEGQDVDLAFVVSPKTKDEENITELLRRFSGYAEKSYPDTERTPTKSSVNLAFASNLNYDLVPLLGTSDPEKQILIRDDGERRETSVQRNIDFVRGRTKKSQSSGGVPFNECVRLMKWWREVRQGNSSFLNDVPSVLVDLLSAAAFDRLGTKPTYQETLGAWAAWLANAVRQRTPIIFKDLIATQPPASNDHWRVLDPVNFNNNIVSTWSDPMVDELAKWFEEARDSWAEARASELDDDESGALDALVRLFGNAFRIHGEPQ